MLALALFKNCSRAEVTSFTRFQRPNANSNSYSNPKILKILTPTPKLTRNLRSLKDKTLNLIKSFRANQKKIKEYMEKFGKIVPAKNRSPVHGNRIFCLTSPQHQLIQLPHTRFKFLMFLPIGMCKSCYIMGVPTTVNR